MSAKEKQAVAAFFSYNQEGFTGSRVKNPDSYSLDIERMNGTDLHTLDLKNGGILIDIVKESPGVPNHYYEIREREVHKNEKNDCILWTGLWKV